VLKRIKEKFKNLDKKIPSSVDLHSHLIPQIDDGSDSIKTSLKLVRQMKNLGYKKLIITPHIMKKKYPNDMKIIRQGLLELRSYLKVENIEIEIEAAAEYYCDEHFLSLIRSKELLSFGKQYVLLELPYTMRPEVLERAVLSLLQFNYKPVLAHPERYRFLNSVLEYRKLKELGLLFQVNINSLGGYYGQEAKKKALMLSQKSMIDFVGSDLHHEKHMKHFEKNVVSNHVEMLFRKNKILNDTL